MSIIFQEPYNSWLKSKIGENFDENTKFVLKVAATTSTGVIDVNVTLDLTWFVLIEIKDTDEMKLQVAELLLQEPKLLEQFKSTLDNIQVKRLIAEFLLYNFSYLDKLKKYIDFTKLNLPIDFVSHALLLKRGDGVDSDQISLERIKIVYLVLDTGFSLALSLAANLELPVLHKVLSMGDVAGKFSLAKRLLALGFKLFIANNPRANTEVAVFLIEARDQADCKAIIKDNKDQFLKIIVQVPGNSTNSNLADYYYWVKEDMDAVRFIKNVLGIQLSSTT